MQNLIYQRFRNLAKVEIDVIIWTLIYTLQVDVPRNVQRSSIKL